MVFGMPVVLGGQIIMNFFKVMQVEVIRSIKIMVCMWFESCIIKWRFGCANHMGIIIAVFS